MWNERWINKKKKSLMLNKEKLKMCLFCFFTEYVSDFPNKKLYIGKLSKKLTDKLHYFLMVPLAVITLHYLMKQIVCKFGFIWFSFQCLHGKAIYLIMFSDINKIKTKEVICRYYSLVVEEYFRTLYKWSKLVPSGRSQNLSRQW